MIQRRSHHAPKLPARAVEDEGTQNEEKKTGFELASRMALSITEMAQVLHISPTLAYELAKQEDFPSFYIGHHKLINKEGLQRWIDERCKGVAVPMNDRELTT